MRRILVVGCGGSGAKTLAFIMDQLRADLAQHGFSKIPDVWQFVNIDTPVQEESGPAGIPNVTQQGGTYVPCGIAQPYSVVDYALMNRLKANAGMRNVASWIPRRPEDVTFPITDGAGQYRGIGRLLILNKLAPVYQALQNARARMYSTAATSEAQNLADTVPGLNGFASDAECLVFVVSSMAGGSGASSALDVCRLLTAVQGIQPGLIGLFLYTSEVFKDFVDESAATGMPGNTLAMMGEIFASQASQKGKADHLDQDLYKRLGHQQNVGQSFARVFPIGSRIGGSGAKFGDGSKNGVFRGIGRGLARLLSSDKALAPFTQYDLGNTGSLSADRSYIGWGQAWDQLPWGSFGYASLSMGRDRYAEYAAQRLAKSAVDHLSSGHLQPGDNSGAEERLRLLWETRYGKELERLGFPQTWAQNRSSRNGVEIDADLDNWVINMVLGADTINDMAGGLTNRVLANLPRDTAGQKPAQWLEMVRAGLGNQSNTALSELDKHLQAWSFDWSQERLMPALTNSVQQEIADLGLAYALRVVRELEGPTGMIRRITPGLRKIAQTAPNNALAIPAQLEQQVAAVGGKLTGGYGPLMELLRQGLQDSLRQLVVAYAAHYMAELLDSFDQLAVAPLRSTLEETMRGIDQARQTKVSEVGVAQVATAEYGLWPDAGPVPERFGVAHNEEVITSPEVFPLQFDADIVATVSKTGTDNYQPGPEECVRQARTEIICGSWVDNGPDKAPRDTLKPTRQWVPGVFQTNPRTGATMILAPAKYELKLSPKQIIERARTYINRKEEPFSIFITQSLKSYLGEYAPGEATFNDRAKEVIQAFEAARAMARPLISVDQPLTGIIHNADVSYRYKFSSLPFKNTDLEKEIQRVIDQDTTLDQVVSLLVKEAFTDDEVSRIDIFGSYPNYAPLVFSGVLDPIREHWHSLPELARSGFWQWRRARPIPGGLPMGDVERKTFVQAWYAAQIVGGLDLPERGNISTPAKIYDRQFQQWLEFPWPMLTPPADMQQSYEWLCAVLESVLLAYADTQTRGIDALRPFVVLRGYCDESENAPESGRLRSDQELITKLINDGIEQGGKSRVPNMAQASTPTERGEAALAWLKTIKGIIEDRLLPGAGKTEGPGFFTNLSTRELAGEAPRMIDLADESVVAINEITQIVQTAMNSASAEEVVF